MPWQHLFGKFQEIESEIWHVLQPEMKDPRYFGSFSNSFNIF